MERVLGGKKAVDSVVPKCQPVCKGLEGKEGAGETESGRWRRRQRVSLWDEDFAVITGFSKVGSWMDKSVKDEGRAAKAMIHLAVPYSTKEGENSWGRSSAIIWVSQEKSIRD